MPVMTSADDAIARSFIDATRHRLAESLAQIEHCLEQLPDDDLYRRPSEPLNSVSNIILHLCGNVRQWIISGVGGAPDVRLRSAEFSDRSRVPRETLLADLRATIAEADAVLARIGPETILAVRRIQGFETNVMSAIVDTATHFVGHMQEITYITRMYLGAGYAFRWTPATPEEGAPLY